MDFQDKPFAQLKSTLEQTIALNPDRIAFYSYTYVPHLKPVQKSFEAV